jgi:hypothetical protein
VSEPTAPPPDEPPPEKLPRGFRFGRMARADLFRIVMFAGLLVALLMLRKPCADGVGGMFRALDTPPGADDDDAGVEYIRLTPEEIQKRFPAAGTHPAPPPGTPTP